MAKLGFLGLGIMGYPMARNLLNAGHEVALWSHTASKAAELAKTGKGTACSTPAEVGLSSECVVLCVGDSEMSEKAVLGPDGVASGAKPGTVVVDASTVSRASSRKMHEALSAKGLHFLDAPCTGSKPGESRGGCVAHGSASFSPFLAIRARPATEAPRSHSTEVVTDQRSRK